MRIAVATVSAGSIATLAQTAWVPITSASSWSFSKPLQMPWNNGVVIPATGTYSLMVTGELVGTGLTHGRFVLKKNDITATNAGTVLASQGRFDAGSVIISAARELPLVAGDTLTPAFIAFGSTATVTSQQTGFSVRLST